jgi:heat shock protein HslJ
MKPIVVISIVFLTACYPDETISGQSTPEDVWVLTKLYDKPAKHETTLTFPEEGRIEGNGPCKSYFASQKAPLPWIEIGPIASTRKLCAPDIMEQETGYFAALERASIVELSENHLILSEASTIIAEFTKN